MAPLPGEWLGFKLYLGDENPIRTLGDYSIPSHEGYQNTIELPDENNMMPLRSDTIWLVQNGCSFHGLRSISTWEDLTTHFLASILSTGRTAKLQNDNLMFQQHQGESLSEAWTRFKDLLQKELARYEDEGWNDPILPEEGSLNYKNPDIKQLLGIIEYHVDTLMKDAISIMGRSENIFRISSNMMRQLPPEPSHQEAFKDLVMNFILDQEEKVKKLKEYMGVIGGDFMQLSSKVVGKLKEEIRMEENRAKKIEKITRYHETEKLEPLNNHKLSQKRYPSVLLNSS
ncbi:zinc finger, CCHC-type containing protein [Tanacetum coccineum]